MGTFAWIVCIVAIIIMFVIFANDKEDKYTSLEISLVGAVGSFLLARWALSKYNYIWTHDIAACGSPIADGRCSGLVDAANSYYGVATPAYVLAVFLGLTAVWSFVRHIQN